MVSKRIMLFLVVFFILLNGILAQQANSTSYDSRSKLDSGASDEASSTSFVNRFIMGIQAVSQYISDSFIGRFGVLEDSSPSSQVNVSSCGNLDIENANYVLNQSVSSSGTCFTILANNVSLNCNGFYINFSQSSAGYGIYGNSYSNSQISNCNIQNGNNDIKNSAGIYFSNGENSILRNNNFTINSRTNWAYNHGSHVSNFSGANLSRNNFNVTGFASYGVYLENSPETELSNNRLITTNHYSYGIISDSSPNLFLYNNNISTDGDYSRSIYINSPENDTLKGNALLIEGISGRGVYIVGPGRNLTLIDNYITVGGKSYAGIFLEEGLINNLILNNTLNLTRPSVGLRISNYVNSTLISRNYIYTNSTSSMGIFAGTGFINNTIEGNNIEVKFSDGYGIVIDSSSSNLAHSNTIVNNTINAWTYALKIRNSASNFIYNNYFNSTIYPGFYLSNNVGSFNTTLTDISPETNIIEGNYLGGNTYATELGNGYSQSCGDIQNDGICDNPYNNIGYSSNIDYLPLSLGNLVPPQTSIISPENQSFVNGRVGLVANASDDNGGVYGISRVKFQYTNSSLSDWVDFPNCEFTSWNYYPNYRCFWYSEEFSNNGEGYNVRVIAYDKNNNSGTDVNKFTIDRTKPIVYDLKVIYPNEQGSIRDGQLVNITATVTDSPILGAGIDYLQAYIPNLNSSLWTNMEFISGSKASDMNSTWRLSVEVTSGLNGVKNVPLVVYDAANPSHNSEGNSWYIQLDNTSPGYNSLDGTSGIYNNSVATFSVLASDNFKLKKYILSTNYDGNWINESEVELNGTLDYATFSKVVYTGDYSYKFYLFDDAGNMNETSMAAIEVLGNSPSPDVNLMSPEDGKLFNINEIQFNYSYSGPQVENCTLILDSLNNETVTSPQNNTVFSFNKNVVDGEHSWSVFCSVIEPAGVENVTNNYYADVYSFNVDTTSPTLNILSPQNSTYSYSEISLNVSGSESLDSCLYSINDGSNFTLSIFNDTLFYGVKIFDEGPYKTIFSCNDSYGNFGTATEYFSVDFNNIYINVSYPLNGQEISRGSDRVTWEDDQGKVSDILNLSARVYSDSNGLEGATCYFYINDVLQNESYTNSTGYCNYDLDKSSLDSQGYKISVNYSYLVSDFSMIENISEVNFSLAKFYFPNFVDGKGIASQFVDNQIAIFYFNITKTNSSGTVFYDPQNISVNATDSADRSYPESSYVDGYRLNKTSTGQYQIRVVVNKSFGTSWLRWKGEFSDDGFSSYLGSVLHTDIQVLDGPICGNNLLESGEDCDDGNNADGDSCPSTCTNSTAPGGGGGGSDTCTSECNSGDSESSCFDEDTIRTRTCGNYDSDSCTEWSSWSSDVCGTDRICSNAQCVLAPTCQNECVLGSAQSECLDSKNSRSRTCGNYDSDSCTEWGDWSLETCLGNDVCFGSMGICSSCVENWVCEDWDTCSEGTQTRICRDYNSCGTEASKPITNQSCIQGIEIDYSPKKKDLLLAVGDNVDFRVDIKNLNGESSLISRWFLDSVRQKEDSNFGNTLSSQFSNTFNFDANVRSEIYSNSQNQNIDWEIEINKTAPINCEPNWVCEWSDCEEVGGYSYSYDCVDINACGTNKNEPYQRKCSCVVERVCEEWSDCYAVYDVDDVLEGRAFAAGYQERTCEDRNSCAQDKVERRSCSLRIPIEARTVEWCQEEYIEIYDVNTNSLVSRVKESEVGFGNLTRLDISLLTTGENGYCDYCFDGVKNFDETGVDCGGSCQECVKHTSFFNWLIWAMWLFWLIFGALIVAEVVNDKESIGEVIEEISTSEILPETKKEKVLESKIEGFFGNIFNWKKTSDKKIIPEKKKVVQKVRLEKTSELSRNIDFFGLFSRKTPEEKAKSRRIKVIKSERKKAEKIIKKRKKVQERIIKKRRKAEKKEVANVRKKKIKSLKKEIRKRKILGLMKKLRLWKKEGYYGTAALEAEIRRLKSE